MRSVVRSPQATAMRFNDRAADRQSHAGPMKLGSKERIEDLIRLLRGQPHSDIANGDQQFTLLSLLRLDRKFPSGVHFLHSIDAIKYEIHEDLLQLHTISRHLG